MDLPSIVLPAFSGSRNFDGRAVGGNLTRYIARDAYYHSFANHRENESKKRKNTTYMHKYIQYSKQYTFTYSTCTVGARKYNTRNRTFGGEWPLGVSRSHFTKFL